MEVSRFICEYCGCSYRHNHDLKKHIRIKHDLNVLEHKCLTCKRIFSTKQNLLRHQKESHSSESYTCNLCNTKFKALRFLKEHIRLRHVEVHSEEAQENQHTVDKRHVGSMARTGQLPFQGKRSYVSLVRNGDLPFYTRKEWNKKMHPMMSGGRNLGDVTEPGKRYVGSLARSGNLPFNREGKRSDDDEASEVDNLLQGVLATEDLWRHQLKALKQELLREEEEVLEEETADEGTSEDKRNLASLARSGNFPFKDGKRSVEALARAGYLPAPKQPQESEEYPHESTEDSEELLGKRSISILAKNGQLGSQGVKDVLREENKRGGIGSLARNGYLHPKRAGDEAGDDLDELIQELYEEEQDTNKRNIGSLARGFNLPYTSGKRNLGSLARGGGFRFGGATKRNDEDEESTPDEDKRNIASIVRSRFSPFQEGKRYLGSIMRNQGSQFGLSKKDDSDNDIKRNIGAMARNWHLPEHLKYGKRFDDEEDDVEDIAKRYIAALLRNGRIPVGAVAPTDNFEEDKRHIGSLAAKSSFQIHKKDSRSTGSDDVAYNNTQQVETSSKSKRSVQHEENQIPATTNAGGEGAKRSKRQAYLIPAASSDEFPMPVMQNSDLFDYEDLAELLSGGAAPEKRFLGSVARSGWFRDGNRNRMLHTSMMTKRHIGSLARLGWLPAFRSSRYSRSGRASPAPLMAAAPADEDSKSTAPREDSTDGEAASENKQWWPPTSSLEEHLNNVKRYLLLPAVDNILLRRLYPRRFLALM